MRLLLSLLFISILPSNCNNLAREKVKSLQEIKPHILSVSGAEIFQYWDLKNNEKLCSNELGEIWAIDTYRDSLELVLGDSVFHTAMNKEAFQRAPAESLSANDSMNNYNLVHLGYLGMIRPINFMEAEILNYQLARYPLLGHPTEFHGFIAVHDSLGLLRIYFGASDAPFPPKPAIIMEHLDKAQERGWRLKYHLHNHYEPESNNYVGIMAPSLADAQYYKMLKDRYGLEQALITNGFNTVVLKASEFHQFNSH